MTSFDGVSGVNCLRADVSYFLCCTRATKEIGDVCTQAMVSIQYNGTILWTQLWTLCVTKKYG